jgi:hypothetical protein
MINSEPKEPALHNFYDVNMLAKDVADIIYRQGKAQVFNVLESQIEDHQRLNASKRMVENLLSNIGRDAKMLIKDVLGDWKVETSIEFFDSRNCSECGNRMPLSVTATINPATRCNRKCSKDNGFIYWEPSCGEKVTNN